MPRTWITTPLATVSALLTIGVIAAPTVVAAPNPSSSRTTATIATFPSPKVIWKLTLIQGKPVIKNIANPSAPDVSLELFGAKLSDQSGKAVGVIEGSITTVDVLAGATEEVLRKRSLTFILAGGEIQAEGASYYPRSAQEMDANHVTRIAIVGGTGKYVGASGQVATVHRGDGTYTQTIELVRY